MVLVVFEQDFVQLDQRRVCLLCLVQSTPQLLDFNLNSAATACPLETSSTATTGTQQEGEENYLTSSIQGTSVREVAELEKPSHGQLVDLLSPLLEDAPQTTYQHSTESGSQQEEPTICSAQHDLQLINFEVDCFKKSLCSHNVAPKQITKDFSSLQESHSDVNAFQKSSLSPLRESEASLLDEEQPSITSSPDVDTFVDTFAVCISTAE